MKKITVHYLDPDDAPIVQVFSGAQIGYNVIGENLFKVWADRNTLIIPIDRLLFAYMED